MGLNMPPVTQSLLDQLAVVMSDEDSVLLGLVLDSSYTEDELSIKRYELSSLVVSYSSIGKPELFFKYAKVSPTAIRSLRFPCRWESLGSSPPFTIVTPVTPVQGY